jgi:hypothetical protein
MLKGEIYMKGIRTKGGIGSRAVVKKLLCAALALGMIVMYTPQIAFADSGAAQASTSVNVSSATLSLNVNDSQKLTAEVKPAPAEGDTNAVTWTSSDESVATVGSDGTVKGLTKGNTTVTASYGTTGNTIASGTCAVTVNDPSAEGQTSESAAGGTESSTASGSGTESGTKSETTAEVKTLDELNAAIGVSSVTAIKFMNDISGNVSIDRDVTVDMNGHKLSGTDQHSVITVSGAHVVTVKNGTITGGKGDKDGRLNSYIGGGINAAEGGTVTLDGCTVTGNTATAGAGIFIKNGTLTTKNTDITANTAEVNGGGISAAGTTVTMNGGKLDSNKAAHGGGIYANSGSTVSLATVSNNKAVNGNGGGMWIQNSTLSKAGTVTGNYAYRDGGGIFIDASEATLNDSTINNNEAGASGGGINIDGGSTVSITASITGNKAGALGGGVSIYNSYTSYNASGNIHKQLKSVSINGTISDNYAATGGGGVSMSSTWYNPNISKYDYASKPSINIGAEISGNKANTYGGGVYARCSEAAFTGNITGNGAMYGGGVYGEASNLQANNITGNSATYGGGIFNTNGSFSGINHGSLVMLNGNISGNKVSETGGGICNMSGSVKEAAGAIYGNTAATMADDVYNEGGAKISLLKVMGNDSSSMGSFDGKGVIYAAWYGDGRAAAVRTQKAMSVKSDSTAAARILRFGDYFSDYTPQTDDTTHLCLKVAATGTYKVVGNYFTNGKQDNSEPVELMTSKDIFAAGTEVTANPDTAWATYKGKTYTLADNANTKCTIQYDSSKNVITLTYNRTESTSVDPSASAHTLTINYVDESGKALHEKYTASLASGTKYSQDSPGVAGYTFADKSQMTISGTMADSDITINVVYKKLADNSPQNNDKKKPTAPTNNGTTTSTTSTSSAPATGDSWNGGMMLLLVLLGAAGAVTPAALRKRDPEK